MANRSVLRPALPADGYAPNLRVRVDGQELTTRREQRKDKEVLRSGDVIDVQVTLDIANPSSFSISLNNWDYVNQTFLYSTAFEIDQPVTIDLGYADELARVFNGKISSLNPNFPDSGPPTITLRGQDGMRDLANRKPKPGETRSFPNKRDWEIIPELAEKVFGLSAKVTRREDLPRELIVIKDQTYAEFLAERAKRIDHEFYFGVDQSSADGRDTLYFVERSDGRNGDPVEAFALVWGLGTGERPRTSPDASGRELSPNLISFTPTFSNAQQVEELTVRGWDPRTKKSLSYTATAADLSDGGTQRRAERVAKKDSSEQVVTMPVASQAEARRLAISMLRERRNKFATGSGKVIGLPRLQPGCIVQIFGLGERFSGDYFVTKVDHQFGGSGYTTSFEVDRSRQRRGANP
jgi:phage protein D